MPCIAFLPPNAIPWGAGLDPILETDENVWMMPIALEDVEDGQEVCWILFSMRAVFVYSQSHRGLWHAVSDFPRMWDPTRHRYKCWTAPRFQLPFAMLPSSDWWFHPTLHDLVPQGNLQFPFMDHEIERRLTAHIKCERKAKPVECRFWVAHPQEQSFVLP